ncbi:MAG: nucleotidyltransferase domain-containing protein [Dysgonamonadaceae bacterium]|jgi:predicted nucleotidyltransferase|nr:nucleotidyltransferase domain-containing protein [Dysgonamonadaceae bacterium]
MNQQIFEEIQALKRQILPDQRVILYGSQARGDNREDSDWDLLVLLDKEKRNFIEDSDKYAYPFTELGLKYDTLIMATVYTVKDWETHPSLFRHNVEREGIEIV